MIKITIIVPIFNAERSLARCIESIICQTYTKLEIILVNDGSQDNSLKICHKYAKDDKRIVVIDQANGGASKARNTGMKNATGEYVGFVDSDDYVIDDFVEKMVQAAQNSNADVIICNILNLKDGVTISKVENLLPKNTVLKKQEIREEILKKYYSKEKGGNFASTCNKFYKLAFLRDNQLYIDETKIRAEDYWYNFHAFRKANAVYALDFDGYYYNIDTPQSIMKTFRENEFDKFIEYRNELLYYNEDLHLPVDLHKWDIGLVDWSNEFILICIKNIRYDVVKKIITNKDFLHAYSTYNPVNIHTKLIKLFLKLRLNLLVVQIYTVWSLKFKI